MSGVPPAPQQPATVTAEVWTPPKEFDGYQLRGVLGQGGMGQVFLGHDKLLDRPVAIKFMSAAHEQALEFTLREARAAAKLQHPNVVSIYRVGEIDGHPYIVSEYLRGRNLHELRLPLPWQKVLEVGLSLTRGLAAAHRRGILHRDLKPSNAILTPEGEVKLIDFGIAEIISKGGEDAPPLDERQLSADPLPTGVAALEATTDLGPPPERMAAQVRLAPSDSTISIPEAATIHSSDAEKPVPPDRSLSPPSSWSAPAPRPPVSPPPGFEAATKGSARGNVITGTPVYMAPEVLRGEPSSPRSDIYSMGALLYTLCAKGPPFFGMSFEELVVVVNGMDAPSLAVAAPGCDPRFAEIVDRCLRRDPAERYATADELREAMEALLDAPHRTQLPEGNPYRGLRPFEAEHRGLFFGRRSEVGTLVERLRTEPSLLIGGDSGVGKSSLVRAGVLPLLSEGVLDRHRKWAQATIVPGRHPHAALLQAVGQLLGGSAAQLGKRLVREPRAFGRELHALLGDKKGAVLVVDQLEELVTVSDPAEAEWVAEALGSLIGGSSGFRLLMTARADYLSRLGALPGLGDEISRAFYLLRPLSRDKLREVITGPARCKGVSFESEALVTQLADSAALTDGGLPLLQFTLAELWEARSGSVITAQALQSIGGVEGALARHADLVLTRLSQPQRRAAQRILLSLLTHEGTQQRRTFEELTQGNQSSREALEQLVQGRLVVARETADGANYELAHEALIKGWVTLRAWLDRQGERRAAYQRLALAAREWRRLERTQEALWSARQLAEAEKLDELEMGPHELEFLEASRRLAQRLRWRRRAALLSLPVAALLVGLGLWVIARRSAYLQISELIVEGREYLKEMRRLDADIRALEQRAFAAYDGHRLDEAEQIWREVVKQRKDLIKAEHNTHGFVKSANKATGRMRPDALQFGGESYYDMAVLAERRHDREQVAYFLKKFPNYDKTGVHTRRWNQPGKLTLSSSPPGAEVFVQRYSESGTSRRWQLDDEKRLGQTPLDQVALAPGSYLLTLRAAGRIAVQQPLLVHRDERIQQAIDLPRPETVPEGMVYVPAGTVQFGTYRDEETRSFVLQTMPMHEVAVPAFLISRHEVTYGEWLAYLRDARPPTSGTVNLTPQPDGRYQLSLRFGSQVLQAMEGQPLVYSGRPQGSALARQDWLRLPVAGVSAEEAMAYAAWLNLHKRPRWARLCTEQEWERAARGADDREYPHGELLEIGDANFIETHGEDMHSVGPDAVGSYPASRSPVGVDDLIGNVAEWTTSALRPGQFVLRGGNFYSQRTRIAMRQPTSPGLRDLGSGIRICASLEKLPLN